MAWSQQYNLQEVFQRANKINTKNNQNQSSLFQLFQIGRNKGFQSSINRKLIWPLLLGLNAKQIQSIPVFQWKKNQNILCPEYQQCKKDADRSLNHFKVFQSCAKFYKQKKQQAILEILNSLFAKNNSLSYIQGFHEIASIIIILFDNSTSYYLLDAISSTYFYDLLTFEIQKVTQQVFQIVYELITKEDYEFKKILGFFPTIKILSFAIPWLITWFSQSFSQIKKIWRLWDYILSTGPYAIIYLIAAVILNFKRLILSTSSNLDQSIVQQIFQNNTKHGKEVQMNVQYAIQIALLLEQKYDIRQLKAYNRLNKNSKYRIQNLFKILPSHAKCYESRRKTIHKQQNINKMIKIGGIAFLLAGAFIFKKQIKANFFTRQ